MTGFKLIESLADLVGNMQPGERITLHRHDRQVTVSVDRHRDGKDASSYSIVSLRLVGESSMNLPTELAAVRDMAHAKLWERDY